MPSDGPAGVERSSEGSLEDARRAVTRERRHLADERAAFAGFRERVEDLDVVRSRGGAPARSREVGGGIARVREAYADTVMAVPHYRERFDEDLTENVAGELSPELAAALARHDRLRPYVKRSLLTAADAAIGGRTTLLSIIDSELESIADLDERLEGIEAERAAIVGQPIDRMEFNALRLSRRRLCGLEERCDDLAAERQATLGDGCRSSPAGDDLGEYLYADCESVHPLLAAIAATGRRIERDLAGVEDRLVAVK
ncbi:MULTISPECIES: DUF7260 family protein [Saliphagus]|uniref:DUF7260 domain-containing protein n=1 Tax=Saliphagus infecundisoli TaxID=1849069 RepID=A0ABD5QDT0_9EURY|nr:MULTISPECIES: hypothetical protein [Saliphagus]